MYTQPATGTELFKAREHETRAFIAPKTYAVLRLDGRAFHTYCARLHKPADSLFMEHMDMVAIALFTQLSGVRLAYVQSDELNLLITDWVPTPVNGTPAPATQFMFGGNIQKLVSISAAIASVTLNQLRLGSATDKVGLFDARIFNLVDRQETIDYFAWRQADCATNSLSMTASAHFSSQQLHAANASERRAMLLAAGIDPDATPEGFRRGRVIVNERRPEATTFEHRRTGAMQTVDYVRNHPVSMVAPEFAVDGRLVPAAYIG